MRVVYTCGRYFPPFRFFNTCISNEKLFARTFSPQTINRSWAIFLKSFLNSSKLFIFRNLFSSPLFWFFFIHFFIFLNNLLFIALKTSFTRSLFARRCSSDSNPHQKLIHLKIFSSLRRKSNIIRNPTLSGYVLKHNVIFLRKFECDVITHKTRTFFSLSFHRMRKLFFISLWGGIFLIYWKRKVELKNNSINNLFFSLVYKGWNCFKIILLFFLTFSLDKTFFFSSRNKRKWKKNFSAIFLFLSILFFWGGEKNPSDFSSDRFLSNIANNWSISSANIICWIESFSWVQLESSGKWKASLSFLSHFTLQDAPLSKDEWVGFVIVQYLPRFLWWNF